MDIATAVERGQWEVAALRILLGVSEQARLLPPDAARELLTLVEGRR